MLPIIKIENERGEVLNLSTDPRYVPFLTGTGPPPATINRAKASTSDGTNVNSTTVDERPLVLQVFLKKDVAKARLNLYRWLATKKKITVYYSCDGLDVFTQGYVETVDADPWQQNQFVQASILCPRPYWREMAETYTNASNVEALFEFEFETDDEGVELSTIDLNTSTIIQNDGTVEAGVTFEITATTLSVNPRIYNLSTGEFIGFWTELQPGDRLEVCTLTGSKEVTHIRDGVRTNYINTMMEGSQWLQMAIGANEYSYTVDEGECELGIYYTNEYVGV